MVLMTMAVDDKAIQAPIIIAAEIACPINKAMAANTAVVSNICPAPTPNTSRRIATMRARLNSRPRLNNKNTMPTSAARCMSLVLENKASNSGPVITPATRYAKMGGKLTRLNSHTNNTATAINPMILKNV